jgi:hypothetical protein
LDDLSEITDTDLDLIVHLRGVPVEVLLPIASTREILVELTGRENLQFACLAAVADDLLDDAGSYCVCSGSMPRSGLDYYLRRVIDFVNGAIEAGEEEM